MSEMMIATGSAIKALDDNGRIGGYLAAWGSPEQRDLQGEYFTPQTNFELSGLTSLPVLYHHGLDDTLKARRLGTLDTFKADAVGLWVEGQMGLHDEYTRAIWDMIKRGMLSWSSGSMPHQAYADPTTGEIKYWPLYEGSETPTPADWRGTTRVMSIKTYASTLIDLAKEPFAKEPTAKDVTIIVQEVPNEGEPEEPEREVDTMDMQTMVLQLIDLILQQLNQTLTDQQKQALAAQILPQVEQMDTAEDAAEMNQTQAAAAAQQAAPIVAKAVADFFKAEAEKKAQFTAVIADAAKSAVAAAAPVSRVDAYHAPVTQPRASQIQVRTKYADMSAEDMSYYLMLKNATRKRNNLPPWLPEGEFMRELASKAEADYAAGKIRFANPAAAVKGMNALKANELDHSTQATYGDEWVPDLWSNQIWERTRLDNVVAPLFQNVEMPSNPYELPIESTDPTVYFVPETTGDAQLSLASGAAITESKMATGKVTLTAKKLALRVGFSMELDEDSIIGWTAQLRKQALRALQDALDNSIVNGDTVTTATTNINLIDGTPGGTEKYCAFNGLRKLWVVTTTANSVDASGAAITLALLRQARFTMSPAYSANPNNLALITHAEGYNKLLGMSEFITIDKAGPQATAMTGELGKLDGMPVLVSAEYAMTNNAGKIPAAGGTLGSYTIVYRPGWYLGYRRQVNAQLEYLSYYDAYQLTATMRVAFINRDGEVAAGVYNALV